MYKVAFSGHNNQYNIICITTAYYCVEPKHETHPLANSQRIAEHVRAERVVENQQSLQTSLCSSVTVDPFRELCQPLHSVVSH